MVCVCIYIYIKYILMLMLNSVWYYQNNLIFSDVKLFGNLISPDVKLTLYSWSKSNLVMIYIPFMDHWGPALQGHPRWTGHSREFWWNVIHWRREWHITPLYLPWENRELHKRWKRQHTQRRVPQVWRYPLCYWGRAEESSRKNKHWHHRNQQTKTDGNGWI